MVSKREVEIDYFKLILIFLINVGSEVIDREWRLVEVEDDWKVLGGDVMEDMVGS